MVGRPSDESQKEGGGAAVGEGDGALGKEATGVLSAWQYKPIPFWGQRGTGWQFLCGTKKGWQKIKSELVEKETTVKKACDPGAT